MMTTLDLAIPRQPPPNKPAPLLCVSLDQNFLSNFAKGTSPEANRLYQLLAQAVAAGKAVCPTHAGETVFESTMCPVELRQKIFTIATELSGGLGFRNFGIAVAIETLELARPGYTQPDFLPDSLDQWIEADLDQAGAHNRAAKLDFARRIAAHPYPPPQYHDNMTMDEVLADIVSERAGSMYRLARAAKDTGTLATGKPEWEATELAARLLLESKITAAEWDRLLHAVLHHQWERTAVIYVHSRLCAQIEWDCLKAGRETKPNDQLDLWRLAVALNDAHVIFCDHAMKAVVTRANIYPTEAAAKVFSFRELPSANTYLEQILV